MAAAASTGALSGALSVLYLYDVSDEIRLDQLRDLLGAPPPGREPSFRHHAPEYVQFARPPVMEPLKTPFGEGRIAYYDYGVVSLLVELPFEGGWDHAINLAARWMNAPDLEQSAAEALRPHLERAAPALVNAYKERLTEDYFIFQLRPIADGDGQTLSAAQLLTERGDAIARIVRGEHATFSESERAEILSARISYYDSDLLVAGWTAALIYDTPEAAVTTIQLLEYANTQLLEFRHYDALLTNLLMAAYRSIEQGTGFFARWRLAREAEHLNTIRLDVRELTERVDNSIKFLSDMFAARLYRMAAARIGVPDYRRLVEQKLESAGDLYGFMMDQYHQSRAFILELMVVIILIIELVFLFRGKS
ncbi:MAG: hypothetical protein JO336_25110 [Acidobacteriia bacterium]|nr:hypothetical protein [Terriglobia bacterium]MBV8906472.1 hypothetical protein [Terriglobia bacterium]